MNSPLTQFIRLLLACCSMLYFSGSFKAQTDSLWQVSGDTVVFIAKRSIGTDKILLSNRDFKRLPGGFDDPSRILLHFPGIAIANDQANGVVYHGLPAHFTQWRLNGLDIVNPNHLSNAGTLSDLASPSAGGVNMYSGNVLDGFQFVAPSLPGKRSWTLGGIADLQTSTTRQNYLQLSVLGLEAGLHKNWNNKARAFANYRYSFTGLLDDMGVSFGNEAIRFEDFTAGFSTHGQRLKSTFLVAAGRSHNQHDALPKPYVTYKDGQNIGYRSNNLTAQWMASQTVATGYTLDFGLAYSQRSDERKATGEIAIEDGTLFSVDDAFDHSQNKWTAKATLATPGRWLLEARWMYDHLHIDQKTMGAASSNLSRQAHTGMLSTYKSFELNPHMQLRTDLGLMYQQQWEVLPGLALDYVQGHHTITASISRNAGVSTLDLPPVVGINYMLDYKMTGRNVKTSISGFYHAFSNLPADSKQYNYLLGYDYQVGPLTSHGLGRSLGLSLMSEWDAGKNWWFNINHSWLRIQYKNRETDDWNHAENDFGWMGNANAGKTLKLGSGVLAIAVSFHYRGGQYYNPALPYPARPVYDQAPQFRFAPYLRWDARINYTKKKGMISLDIQNVTGRQNEGFARYGPMGNYIEYQLGLIPVISYKYIF